MRCTLLIMLVAVAACTAEPKLIADTKESARSQLKDGDSAKFKDVELCSGNKEMVEGELNAKNGFGAYTGFKHFYGVKGLAYLGDDKPLKVNGKTYSYDNQLMLACYKGANPDQLAFLSDVEAGRAQSVEETLDPIIDNAVELVQSRSN